MTSRGRESAAEISVTVDAAGPGPDREWFQASETPNHREDSMSHRAQLTTCIAAAAVPALAIVLLASGAPAAADTAAAAHRPVILRLRALSGQERQVDMPPAGTSLGDEQVDQTDACTARRASRRNVRLYLHHCRGLRQRQRRAVRRLARLSRRADRGRRHVPQPGHHPPLGCHWRHWHLPRGPGHADRPRSAIPRTSSPSGSATRGRAVMDSRAQGPVPAQLGGLAASTRVIL